MAPMPEGRGHSVLAVANEFISLAKDNNIPLTPMHLQKLCYFAQGFNLAYTGKPIIWDAVEAWDFGPVFPRLYRALRKYGAGEVSDPIRVNNWAHIDHMRGGIVKEGFSIAERRLIQDVFSTYASFPAFKLSALTHENDTPWAKVYEPGSDGRIISNALIETYFRELAAA